MRFQIPDLAETELPHLIFLNIVLPGMRGFEALRHLRRNQLTRNIPIIMISGNEQATEQFYLQRIGADDFMRNPLPVRTSMLGLVTCWDPINCHIGICPCRLAAWSTGCAPLGDTCHTSEPVTQVVDRATR